jgi:hypothetical protein
MMERLLGKMDTTIMEMLAKTDAKQEKMNSRNWARQKETTACQEGTKACLENKEPT